MTGRLNTTDLDDAVAALGKRIGDELGSLTLTLGLNHGSLLLLLGNHDDKFGALSLLLGDLLVLNSSGKFAREVHMNDRDIVEQDVELASSLRQRLGNVFRDLHREK